MHIYTEDMSFVQDDTFALGKSSVLWEVKSSVMNKCRDRTWRLGSMTVSYNYPHQVALRCHKTMNWKRRCTGDWIHLSLMLGTEMSSVFKKEILTNWYISNNSPNEFNNWLYKNIHSVQYLKWSDVCKKALLLNISYCPYSILYIKLCWKGLPFEGNFPYRCKG